MPSLSASILSLFLFCSVIAAAQPSLVGHWEGFITVPGGQLEIMTDFQRQGDSLTGTIDIPQQGAKRLKLIGIRYADPTVHFELPTGVGGVAMFDGARAGDSIAGNFRQGNVAGSFSLHAGKGRNSLTVGSGVLAPAYREEEVTFTNGLISLAGTLTLPLARGRYPAVILVTGSGPQNRDEEIFGFRPFQMIADSLTRAGIAVLRYDDRGVGGSTGSFAAATTADFAEDALAAFNFLKAHADIDPKRIGMLGHSEGGAIAPIVANRSKDLAFIVLMAGPGVKGSETINAQIIALGRAGGSSREELRATIKVQEKLYAALRSGKGFEEVEEDVRQATRRQLAALPRSVRDTLDTASIIARSVAQLASARSPWFTYFIDLDPALALRNVTCPVLALFGELDMQVPANLNRGPVVAALKKAGNRDVTVKVIPKANHLFQKSRTGLPDEYAQLPKEFAPGFLDTVVGWIRGKVKP